MMVRDIADMFIGAEFYVTPYCLSYPTHVMLTIESQKYVRSVATLFLPSTVLAFT